MSAGVSQLSADTLSWLTSEDDHDMSLSPTSRCCVHSSCLLLSNGPKLQIYLDINRNLQLPCKQDRDSKIVYETYNSLYHDFDSSGVFSSYIFMAEMSFHAVYSGHWTSHTGGPDLIPNLNYYFLVWDFILYFSVCVVLCLFYMLHVLVPFWWFCEHFYPIILESSSLWCTWTVIFMIAKRTIHVLAQQMKMTAQQLHLALWSWWLLIFTA